MGRFKQKFLDLNNENKSIKKSATRCGNQKPET